MKFFAITLIVLFISNSLFSQIKSSISNNETKLVKEKGVFNSPSANKTISIDVDIAKVLKETIEEEASELGLPYCFGKAVDTDYTLQNAGTWFSTETGRVWKLRIKSKGAYSLGLIFSKLVLSGLSELYIYNEERTMVYGPVVSSSSLGSQFQTDVIKGESIIIELFEPFEEKGKTELHLITVVHGFRNIFEPTLFGESETCQNDISCTPSAAAQGDGVAMIILANGTRACSGSLLNNGCQDFTPNILTAFHCIDIGNDINNVNACTNNEVGNGVLTPQEITNAQNWIFRFQYKRASCNSGPEPTTYYTFQQATIRATWFNTDVALVQMNQSPTQVPNTGIKYLGWSRNDTAPTSGYIIGHPKGDVMKISTFNTPATANTNSLIITVCDVPSRESIYPSNSHWQATINSGGLQGGSSGGPFFNQEGRVVGQLHGGVKGCAPKSSVSGRFNVSWDGGGDATNSLRPWLTNDNSIMQTNSLSIPYIVRSGGGGYPIICNTTVGFNLMNPPSTTTHNVTWTTTSNLSIISQGSNSVLVKYSGSQNGTGTITANIINTNQGLCPVSTPISLNVQAGPFNTGQILVGGQPAVCKGYSYTYTANFPGGHQSGFSYAWTYPTGWSVMSQSQNSITLYVPLYNTQYGTVRVSVNNGCGATGYTGITVYPGYSCGSYAFNYYPNPVEDEITVEAVSSDDASVALEETVNFECIIYDEQKNELKRAQSAQNKAVLSVRKIKPGLYYLHIFSEAGILREKIIVNH